jgi:hypothetical protein
MDSCTHVDVGSRDNWDELQSKVQAGGAGRAWVSVLTSCSTCLSVLLLQYSVLSFVAAQLLLPTLVTFNPRHRPEFEDVWAGTYCTFAKEKSQGEIYVFGLNNYNHLGEFDFLNGVRLWDYIHRMQSSMTLWRR